MKSESSQGASPLNTDQLKKLLQELKLPIKPKPDKQEAAPPPAADHRQSVQELLRASFSDEEQ